MQKTKELLSTNRSGFVLVELVWPESRGAKNDCRAGTSTMWSGHGDVQWYPAALWSKLAPHPDVWRLIDVESAQRAIEVAAAAKRAAEDAALVLKAKEDQVEADKRALHEAEIAADKAEELERSAAQAAKDAGVATNTDVVTLTPLPGIFSAEQLDAMSDDEVREEAKKAGFELHPRLNPVNLRVRFLSEQEAAGLPYQTA